MSIDPKRTFNMNTRSKCAIAITLVIISMPTVASSNSEVWTTTNGSVVVDGNGNPVRTIHYNHKTLAARTQVINSEKVAKEKVNQEAKITLVKVAQQGAAAVFEPEPEPIISSEKIISPKPILIKILDPVVKSEVKKEIQEETKQEIKQAVVVQTPIIKQPKTTITQVAELKPVTQKVEAMLAPQIEYRFNHYQTTVLFDTASATLSDNAMGSLKQLVITTGLAQSVISVQVIGHADTRGGEAYNMTLSEQRMRSVASYLNALKLKVTSMFAKGETSPVVNNLGEDLTKSRRVHVAIKTRHLRN